MFRALLLSALMLFAVPSFAQETGPNPCADIANATKDLTPQATATLLESCRTKATTAVEKLADPDVANKWAEAAKGIGQGIGVAAKELGIAANDFLDSPAGLVVAVLLLFNFAGGFMGALIAAPMSVLSLYVLYKLLVRLWVEKATYTMVPVLWGAFSFRRVTEYTRTDADESVIFMTTIYLASAGLFNMIVWLNLT